MQHRERPTEDYPHYGYVQPSPYPPPQMYAPPPYGGYPPHYAPWGFPNAYNPYHGGVFNSGGNTNGSGNQKNGDVKVGNHKHRMGGVRIGRIGGNHGNHGGQQLSGDVKIGDIGGGYH